MEDEKSWGLTGKGIFIIKSVIWFVYGINLCKEIDNNFDWIWKINVYLKIKIFLW